MSAITEFRSINILIWELEHNPSFSNLFFSRRCPLLFWSQCMANCVLRILLCPKRHCFELDFPSFQIIFWRSLSGISASIAWASLSCYSIQQKLVFLRLLMTPAPSNLQALVAPNEMRDTLWTSNLRPSDALIAFLQISMELSEMLCKFSFLTKVRQKKPSQQLEYNYYQLKGEISE